MLSIEKSTQTLVFFVFENFVTSLLQNLGLMEYYWKASLTKQHWISNC